MSYLSHLAAASGSMGAPPAPQQKAVGAPPMPQPHITPAPYSVAKDPGWKGIVDPNDHELVNLLDKLEPEERQLLQQRVLQKMGGGAAPPPMPGASPVGPIQ